MIFSGGGRQTILRTACPHSMIKYGSRSYNAKGCASENVGSGVIAPGCLYGP